MRFRLNLFAKFVTALMLCTSTYLPTAWADTEIAKINDLSSRGSRFAQSVAISNDVAIIGASEENDRVASAGVAYIYRRTQDSWQIEDRLVLG